MYSPWLSWGFIGWMPSPYLDTPILDLFRKKKMSISNNNIYWLYVYGPLVNISTDSIKFICQPYY